MEVVLHFVMNVVTIIRDRLTFTNRQSMMQQMAAQQLNAQQTLSPSLGFPLNPPPYPIPGGSHAFQMPAPVGAPQLQPVNLLQSRPNANNPNWGGPVRHQFQVGSPFLNRGPQHHQHQTPQQPHLQQPHFPPLFDHMDLTADDDEPAATATESDVQITSDR